MSTMLPYSANSLKFNKFYLLCLLLLLASACGEGPPEEMPQIDKRLATTAPSRIFFKNIRSSSYQWEQEPNSRTEYYLLRKLARLHPPPTIYPVIADIWMEGQAHILLRKDENASLPTPTTVYWQHQGEQGLFQLDGLQPISQYEFALQLYRAVLNGYQLEIQFPGEAKKELFAEQQERQYYLLSLQDYLRLTEYDEKDDSLMSQK